MLQEVAVENLRTGTSSRKRALAEQAYKVTFHFRLNPPEYGLTIRGLDE
jgi:hypothetical protein